MPVADAVTVAVCPVETDCAVAVKLTLVVPPGTSTRVGTLSAALLLERLTESPPVMAAAVIVTVQVLLPALAIEELAQLSFCTAATALS